MQNLQQAIARQHHNSNDNVYSIITGKICQNLKNRHENKAIASRIYLLKMMPRSGTYRVQTDIDLTDNENTSYETNTLKECQSKLQN